MSDGMRAALPPDSSSGFAQVLALAGLALVGGLLSVVCVQAQRTNQSLSLLERHVRGDMLASSAVHRILAAIEDPANDLKQRVGIGAGPYRLDGNEPLWLAIEGEAGKLDVLRADTAILRRYLEQNGLSQAAAQSVLQTIAGARQEDDAFVALEALSVALARIGKADHVDADFTVLSRLAGVDPMLADERVLRALPDLSEAEVSTIIRARADLEPPRGVESGHFSTGRPVFTVVATVQWSQAERTVKRVPIEITTGGKARVLSGFR